MKAWEEQLGLEPFLSGDNSRTLSLTPANRSRQRWERFLMDLQNHSGAFLETEISVWLRFYVKSVDQSPPTHTHPHTDTHTRIERRTCLPLFNLVMVSSQAHCVKTKPEELIDLCVRFLPCAANTQPLFAGTIWQRVMSRVSDSSGVHKQRPA